MNRMELNLYKTLLLLCCTIVITACIGDSNEAKSLCNAYEENAKNDDAYGYGSLGDCYFYGNGRKKNIEKALDLYEKSSDLGGGNGKHKLAVTYLFTFKDRDKYQEAIELLLEAKRLDYARSFFAMGVVHKNGLGVEVNIDKARWNFTEGANRYDEPSMVITAAGACYGILGFKIDYDRCVFWKDRLKKFNSYNLYTFKEYLLSELDNEFMREYVVNDEDINAVKHGLENKKRDGVN